MPRRTRAAAGGERGDYSPLADEELISLMGAGDAGAFAALYDRHSRAVYSLSYRIAGEKQAAEDLAQDAFLKVWRSAGTYRAQRGSVKTWILTVVHNRGIDLLRSSSTRRRTREEAEAEAPRSQPSEAFSEAWGTHRRDRLREALRDIPRDQREAVTLVHFSGLTQREGIRAPAPAAGHRQGACAAGVAQAARSPRAPGDGSRVAVRSTVPGRCSPECVEGQFCELRLEGGLGSSAVRGKGRDNAVEVGRFTPPPWPRRCPARSA